MLDFIEDFKSLDETFGDEVLMTPHFKHFSCLSCSKEFVQQHCFANGKYCGNQHIKGKSKYPIRGRNILMEDLRQICIHKAAYEQDNRRQAWWAYLKTCHTYCYGSVNQDCSELAHDFN